MTSEYIDIGVNLTNSALLRDLDGVIERAVEAGVGQMVVTGTSLIDSEMAIELCRQFPEQLVCTAGVHPHDAKEWGANSLTTLKSFAAVDCVRAIGETGLDFNRNYSPQDKQIEVFHEQIELAAAVQKPLFCHQRDAHDTFITILRENRDRVPGVVVHCFTDSKKALYDCLDLDCHIGITGWICDERRGLELQENVKDIPADRLMLETDAPYLMPRDLKPKPKTRNNEPKHLPHIAQAVARHREAALEEIVVSSLATTRAFFSLLE